MACSLDASGVQANQLSVNPEGKKNAPVITLQQRLQKVLQWLKPEETLVPARDFCHGQNLSVAVPDWHVRSFTAARTAQEGASRFLAVGRVLREVLPGSVPAHCLHVPHLSVLCSPVGSANALVAVVLFAGRQREADGFHAVHFHEREVKLKTESKDGRCSYWCLRLCLNSEAASSLPCWLKWTQVFCCLRGPERISDAKKIENSICKMHLVGQHNIGIGWDRKSEVKNLGNIGYRQKVKIGQLPSPVAAVQ